MNAAAKAISEEYPACAVMIRSGASDSRSSRAAMVIRHHVRYVSGGCPISAANRRANAEAAGMVEAVGEGVDGFAPGDLVGSVPAFLMNEYGTYGQQAILPASAIVRRPDGIDAVTGAST
ncbi:alcohol dehydrogenase catalytic domain-containing protein [Streptosporangium sp. NBC_01756]|uniref:alcohol dehydrogenase catalytic domain-containing protein n=1 Tax=Streptosporangium sp. NBC_01756 TaxID=2975950 RepID=UPI002DDAB018|nr:hypothetical protein [Streptosporangium sp. NBC_01756]WSC90813.1 hypothetical protein OIE48_08780 [Streptosporangium sp. NBC_01756]